MILHRYKLNVPENKKATLKLMTEAEKLKKLMSANTKKIPLKIECFMGDKDVKGSMDRAMFEEMVAPFMDNIEKSMKECLESSKLKVEDIYCVEIIGGSSRIPKIKTLIEKVYGKTPSTTLNADEAVSRGCALQCAILSPTFKFREFSVTDIQPYPIKLVWDNEGGIENQGPGEMEVFPAFHPVPFSKLTDVSYPVRHVGLFEIGDVRPTSDGGNQKGKVKVRVNPNGIFGVSSASLLEKHELEEEVPVEMEVDNKQNGENKEEENKEAAQPGAEEPKKEEGKMDTEEPKKEEPKKDVKKEKRKKIVNKTIELPVSQRVQGQLSHKKMQNAVSTDLVIHPCIVFIIFLNKCFLWYLNSDGKEQTGSLHGSGLLEHCSFQNVPCAPGEPSKVKFLIEYDYSSFDSIL